jgi:hypothetical protein
MTWVSSIRLSCLPYEPNPNRPPVMLLYDLILSAISERELTSRHRLIDAVRSAGAIAPAAARPFAELNVAADYTWERLVVEGRIREGPPGHFYLFEPRRPNTRQRVIRMVVFYVLILLIPVVLILATKKGR